MAPVIQIWYLKSIFFMQLPNVLSCTYKRPSYIKEKVEIYLIAFKKRFRLIRLYRQQKL